MSYLATDGEETWEVINKENFDLILLDLKMPKIDGIEIIKRISKTNMIKIPKIIVISGEDDLIQKVVKLKKEQVVEIIKKPEEVKDIYLKIQRVADRIEEEEKIYEIKNRVTKELLNIGFNFKHKGTSYLMDSIIYIYQNNNMNLLDNLEANTYKVIACQNGKNVQNIKTNIIKATNLAYTYQDHNILKEYFMIEAKPTPKMIISTVLTKISK